MFSDVEKQVETYLSHESLLKSAVVLCVKSAVKAGRMGIKPGAH